MYESLDSQFSRTTTGIQSGPGAFYELSWVTTFLNNLGDAEKTVINKIESTRDHSIHEGLGSFFGNYSLKTVHQ